jgi:hypothetical protein
VGPFAKQLKVSSLEWVRQVSLNREPDLGMFGSRLAQQLAGGAKQILVMVALLSGTKWVEGTVRAIVSEATSLHPGVEVQLYFEDKATNADLVLQKVTEFGLPEPSEISVDLLRWRLSGARVLCVVMDGHTGFQESLSRAGFPPECVSEEFFAEMVVPRGKNSNLMGTLHDRADQHRHILYAWTGLRTMPSKVKKRYSVIAFEGPTATDVVNLFKRWLLTMQISLTKIVDGKPATSDKLPNEEVVKCSKCEQTYRLGSADGECDRLSDWLKKAETAIRESHEGDGHEKAVLELSY